MSEVILVVLEQPEAAAGLLRAAGRLSQCMDCSRINVLAVREPIQISPMTAGALIQEADAVINEREHQQRRILALKEAFDLWRPGAGRAASLARWVEAEGSAANVVGERGSRADMIIVARPAEDDRLSRRIFRAALFGTARPVLMIPRGCSTDIGHRVGIAWRDEKRAASAVLPALRCLAGAEEVHVLMGVREGQDAPPMPRILTEHGISARLQVLPIRHAPFGQTLLETAHLLSLDLLVMGAYAHSPLRELILGGVTRYMLTHADIPVLMRH